MLKYCDDKDEETGSQESMCKSNNALSCKVRCTAKWRRETLCIDKKTAPNGTLYNSYSALSKKKVYRKDGQRRHSLKSDNGKKKEFSYNVNNILSIFFFLFTKMHLRTCKYSMKNVSFSLSGKKKVYEANLIYFYFQL